MKKKSFFYRNGLTLVFTLLFIIALIAQAVTGWKEHNNELAEAKFTRLSFTTYLCSGHFISATFENFESEFLQMALYVVLTIKLRQIGSAESKKLDGKEEVDREPEGHKQAPWAVKKGGLILKIYQNSLSTAFAILFLLSWVLHFYGSWQRYNVEQLMKHHSKISLSDYSAEPVFWFETFQNWQSEFYQSQLSFFFLSIFAKRDHPSRSQ